MDRTIGPMSPATAALLAVAVVAAYLIGTFPTAQLVGRRFGFDPTTTGSGNPGASNTTRIGGARAGALVLLGDAGKGALAAGIGVLVDGRPLGWLLGASAVAGHIWPATRGFRGGKGVATVAGVALVCAPLGFLAMAVLFGVLVKVSGKAAVGSLATVVLLPFAQVVLGHEAAEVAIGVALAVAIVVRHRDNIRRLLAGTESQVQAEGDGGV